MGASIDDTNLIIISHGQTAYYSTVKGGGQLIWDLRFGLFDGTMPNASHALDWIKGSAWEGCTQALDQPLPSPRYGYIRIDFDKKIVADHSRYGYSHEISFIMFRELVDRAARGDDRCLPGASLLDHFAKDRLRLMSLHPKILPDRFDYSDLAIASTALAKREEASMQQGSLPYPAKVVLRLPEGWRHIAEDADETE